MFREVLKDCNLLIIIYIYIIQVSSHIPVPSCYTLISAIYCIYATASGNWGRFSPTNRIAARSGTENDISNLYAPMPSKSQRPALHSPLDAGDGLPSIARRATEGSSKKGFAMRARGRTRYTHLSWLQKITTAVDKKNQRQTALIFKPRGSFSSV